MNRKIGIYCSAANIISVALFAMCMLIKSNFGSFLASMFIAFSFIPMICAFREYCVPENKAAGNSSMVFAGAYSVFIFAVYFAQLTTVRLSGLNNQAAQILDYQQYGLFFSFDLLGYGLMALSTFFAGLTVKAETKADKWLKWLLIIHGIFFFSCLIIPMLGLFSPNMNGAEWIGTAVLEFWCVYFIPVGILSFLHFKKKT